MNTIFHIPTTVIKVVKSKIFQKYQTCVKYRGNIICINEKTQSLIFKKIFILSVSFSWTLAFTSYIKN